MGGGGGGGGASGGPPPRSQYKDVTRPDARFQNRQTDIDRSTFERNLESQGFKRDTLTSDVTVFTKPGSGSYVVRGGGNSGPTADFRASGGTSGSPDLKIRLK